MVERWGERGEGRIGLIGIGYDGVECIYDVIGKDGGEREEDIGEEGRD